VSDRVPVTVYTSRDCELCDAAVETVERVADRAGVPVDVETVDVGGDPALRAEYGDRVPYGLVDGEPAFEYRPDERDLKLRLLRARAD
jgi:thiol-disulfide isomerase/thioredoxin